MSMNRKTATKLLLVQWARFQNECIRLEGSTLLTGVNGSGKSTVLDAMTYLLTGNTQFNKAAKDRDRTVIGYVRGDTKSNGTERYIRTGEVISYIAMEFWSPLDQSFLVVGVCMESDNEIACRSSWFICRDARIDEINLHRRKERGSVSRRKMSWRSVEKSSGPPSSWERNGGWSRCSGRWGCGAMRPNTAPGC